MNHLVAGIICVVLISSSPPGIEGTGQQVSIDKKLLVIMLDGFRWDYLERHRETPCEFPGFRRLREQGVSVSRLIPVYPTLSYVNYYSLMTGLYPESHGMVKNYMLDPRHNFSSFLLGQNKEQYEPYWWDDGEPLWITASKQDKTSYWWYWCGCEVEIRGHRPTFCQEYTTSPNPSKENFTNALTEALAVLRNGSTDIAGIYFEKVDSTGHKGGPNNPDLKPILEFIDSELNSVLDRLASTTFPGTGIKLEERINLVIFSDHGMTEVVGGAQDNQTAVIDLYKYINRSDFDKVMGATFATVLQIWPWPGREQQVFDRLKNAHPNMTVHKKSEIPERYHLKGHYRVPPILLVPDLGFVITWTNSTTIPKLGFHGYDNKETNMHGIFFASGPDFKKNQVKTSLDSVDIYQLMCRASGIRPLPNNGTWPEVCHLLRDPHACQSGAEYRASASVSSAIVLILTLFIIP